jgi:urease accessory protein
MVGRSMAFVGLVVGFLGLVAATPAEAHVFGAGGAGFLEGLGHPFSGLDHVLAMVAVGLWAAQIGRPAWWMLPVIFPAAMAGGGLLGGLGAPVPAVETGIALSVLALGLLIGLAVRPALWISVPLVALFAVFHGHAHGAELPEAASALLYGAGFVLATAALHAIGLGLGWMAARPSNAFVFRAAGVALSVAGAVLLVG